MSWSDFRLSVYQYTEKLRDVFGYADPAIVRRYAEARREYKRSIATKDFNPYTEDPNCKTCGKKK